MPRMRTSRRTRTDRRLYFIQTAHGTCWQQPQQPRVNVGNRRRARSSQHETAHQEPVLRSETSSDHGRGLLHAGCKRAPVHAASPGSLLSASSALSGGGVGGVGRDHCQAALLRGAGSGRSPRCCPMLSKVSSSQAQPGPQFRSGRHCAMPAGPERRRLSVAGRAACAGVRVVVNDVLHEEAVAVEEAEADLGSRSQG